MTPKKPTIIPVILAGGNGTRLWPLSRRSHPKQFTKLFGHETLFASTLSRFVDNTSVAFDDPIVVTTNDYRFLVANELETMGRTLSNILIEPSQKDTAPAILAAALYAQRTHENAVVLVVPSDHVMETSPKFYDTLAVAHAASLNGNIVTFGVKPTSAHTGYGYLEYGDEISDGCFALNSFKEKPNKSEAEGYISDGRYFWNSGIFMFSCENIVHEYENLLPNLTEQVGASVDGIKSDLCFERLDGPAWKDIDGISVDYAIMDKSDTVVSVPFSTAWSDVGEWSAVKQLSARDRSSNTSHGNAEVSNCNSSFVYNSDPATKVVANALDNIAIICEKDAVLVTSLSDTQSIKSIVKKMERDNVPQATTKCRNYRPWGWFEGLRMGDRFQVKQLHVSPGAHLSLQKHKHRSEHWIVVNGTATVQIGKRTFDLFEGQSTYIHGGTIHRLSNEGKIALNLIEVQVGGYLGEDDIVRIADKYSRVSGV